MDIIWGYLRARRGVPQGGKMDQLILIVDDDPDVAATVERTLLRAGYQVETVHRGADALEFLRHQRPDLMILDIAMPGMDGFQVASHIRATPELADLPIMFLTARTEIEAKEIAYEIHKCDDYLTKPFNLRELTLKVEAILRRVKAIAEEEPKNELRVGKLTLNYRTFEIITPERRELLTPVEFELMNFLMQHAGQVFSADKLLQEVWGYPPGTGMPDLVRVHVKNIRAKIEPNPRKPIYLRNILRRGYLVTAD